MTSSTKRDQENSLIDLTVSHFLAKNIYSIGLSALLCSLDLILCLLVAMRPLDGARAAFILALCKIRGGTITALITAFACGMIALLEQGAAGEELIICSVVAACVSTIRPHMVTTTFARRVLTGGAFLCMMALVILWEPLPVLHGMTALRIGGTLVALLSLVD